MRARVTAATVFALSVALFSATVLAHMKASKTMPAANSTVTASPQLVQVWFTQAPDPSVSRLELAGPAGPVTLGALKVGDDKSIAAAVTGALASGKYTARWQAAGDDGHVQKGEFAFTVQITQ